MIVGLKEMDSGTRFFNRQPDPSSSLTSSLYSLLCLTVKLAVCKTTTPFNDILLC